jgi:hypothetical protein
MKRLLLIACALVGCALATAQDKPAADATPKKTWTTISASPLAGCVVCDKAVDGEAAETFALEGRTAQACCGQCREKAEKAPAEYAKKLDAAIVAAQSPHYPLKTCPISGKAIDAKAEPIVLEGTLVKLCCKQCVKKAEAKAAEIAGKVEAAAYAQQVATYTAKTCPVSDHELDPAETTDVMCNGRLIRLCCEDCVEEIRKAPAKFIAKLDGDGMGGSKPTEKSAEPAEKH